MTQSHKLQHKVPQRRRSSDRGALRPPNETHADDPARAFVLFIAERIEHLPGVWSEIVNAPDCGLSADLYINSAYMPRLRHENPYLMCHIDHDGILLQQMSLPDREEIQRKGWSVRREDSIRVFLPRDEIEMEIAWRIVSLAYLFETSPSIRPRANGNSPRALPNCSSTAKYWM